MKNAKQHCHGLSAEADAIMVAISNTFKTRTASFVKLPGHTREKRINAKKSNLDI